MMREMLIHVDATPDADYPIRILEAHLQNNEAGEWRSEPRIFADALNHGIRERAVKPREAIACLRARDCGDGHPCPPSCEPPIDAGGD